MIGQLRTQLVGYISVHAYGQYILVPFGDHAVDRPSNYLELLRVGQQCLATIERATRSKWTLMKSFSIYNESAIGTSDDWAASIGIEYSYGIELYPNEFEENGFYIQEDEIPFPAAQLYWFFIGFAKATARNRLRWGYRRI